MSRIALCLALFAFVSSASAQIVYEPVQYQYNSNGTLYYYGGSDPAVHHYAMQPYSPGGTWGRANGWAFFRSDVRSYRTTSNEPLRVYSDATGVSNAGLIGFTPDDARNEAYANTPTYFAKRDVEHTAVLKHDGSWVVPAQARPVRVYKSDGTLIDRGPTTMPRPLLVIPKDALQNQPPRQSDKRQLVMAR